MTFTGDWKTDCELMYKELETIDYYTGGDRNKMLYTDKSGGSMLYGTTWKGFLKYNEDGTKKLRKRDANGFFMTKIYETRPDLKLLFKRFADFYFPEFIYHQVQMNKSFPCPPHFDSKNVGESVLVAFGNYLDGRTCIYNETTKKIEKYDARLEPLIFDGSKKLHWVEPIRSRGTRYSLVFFKDYTKK